MTEPKSQKETRSGSTGEETGVRPVTPIRVFNAQTGARFEVPFQKRVSGLLRALGIDDETVIVIQNDQLLLPGDRIDPGNEVEIRPVISGGSGQ